jgi:hypothetical protein
LASGCGGGGGSSSSDDDSDTTIASRGVITGFGSVYVNGTRYHTGSTQFSVDDDNGSESDLRVGMVVTVKGSKSANGATGSATHIYYDNELKGPVSSITPDPLDATRKTLVILGQSVEVNANTTIDDDGGLTFDTIQLDDVLEVSGFNTDSGLVATHIELQPDDLEIEIRGEIRNLAADSFTINGFPVIYNLTTQLEDIAMLDNDLYVEVEGQLNAPGNTLIASKIEGEERDLDDSMDDAEVEGAIYDFNAAKQTFKILGQAVNAGGARFYPSTLVLANDLIVEAEGHIVNGVLVADEVEQKGKKIKIYATLSAVGADSVSFNFNATDIVARVNHQTEIEDDINDNDILLSQLSAGDFVELEAFDDGSGVINAVEIERKAPDEVRIVGPVEAWDETSQSVTLLGIDFDLSAASYENELDQKISAATFYGALSPGVFIKIKDADSNGVFEKAELDD